MNRYKPFIYKLFIGFWWNEKKNCLFAFKWHKSFEIKMSKMGISRQLHVRVASLFLESQIQKKERFKLDRIFVIQAN